MSAGQQGTDCYSIFHCLGITHLTDEPVCMNLLVFFFIKIPELQRLHHLVTIFLFSGYHMNWLKKMTFSSQLTTAPCPRPQRTPWRSPTKCRVPTLLRAASLWQVPPRRPRGWEGLTASGLTLCLELSEPEGKAAHTPPPGSPKQSPVETFFFNFHMDLYPGPALHEIHSERCGSFSPFQTFLKAD